MNFVLDCSVTAPWLEGERADPYSRSVLESLEHRYALVPVLWSYELANALVTAQKRNIIAASQAEHFMEQVRDLNILVQTVHDMKYDQTLVALGHTYGLTAYDGAYLKLAMVRGLPLATRDEALKKACLKAGVLLFKP